MMTMETATEYVNAWAEKNGWKAGSFEVRRFVSAMAVQNGLGEREVRAIVDGVKGVDAEVVTVAYNGDPWEPQFLNWDVMTDMDKEWYGSYTRKTIPGDDWEKFMKAWIVYHEALRDLKEYFAE